MIRAGIRSLPAYHVPSSSGMIKLDAMENPYPLPESLRSTWLKHLADTPINRYPDPGAEELRAKIAVHEGLGEDQILLGNGSDEIIQMLLIAADQGACTVPSPSFAMYELIPRWLNRPVSTIPLAPDFSLDAGQFLKVCAREKTSIVFLACPNNPTGNLWSLETIREITENFHGLVIIDEAYAPFTHRTHTDLIAPNVLILRTFSKLGWAGLRLGYILGETETISHLDKVRLPYNINSLTQSSASLFLDHYAEFDKQAKTICRQRERVLKAMRQIDGVEVFPSETNFLLFRVADADRVFHHLCERKILIRNLHSSTGLLKNCLRVTIGLPEENTLFLNALEEILA
jgi:histidinol-phosphate aminotransferase